MKRIIALSKLKDFNKLDYFYLLLVFGHFVYLPIIFYFTNSPIFLVIAIEFIILNFSIIFVYEIYDNFSKNNLRVRPYEYKYFLWMSIIFQICIIIFIVGVIQGENQSTLLTYFLATIFVIAVFTYIFILLILFLLLLDCSYYFFLKKIFPEESSNKPQKFVNISFLSKEINLTEQKLYLNTAIINFIVYIIAVIYVFLGIMSLVPTNDDIIKIIVEFSKENSVASFGNTLGIISLTIAIYTTTYAVQSKIYDEALKNYNENHGTNNNQE